MLIRIFGGSSKYSKALWDIAMYFMVFQHTLIFFNNLCFFSYFKILQTHQYTIFTSISILSKALLDISRSFNIFRYFQDIVLSNLRNFYQILFFENQYYPHKTFTESYAIKFSKFLLNSISAEFLYFSILNFSLEIFPNLIRIILIRISINFYQSRILKIFYH